MNQFKYFFQVIGVLLFLGFCSCRSQKEVRYFQDFPKDSTASTFPLNKMKNYEPTIHHNDILKIYVSSLNNEASSYFNPVIGEDSKAAGYLVDSNGEIEFPIIGSVSVEGLTIPLIKDTLKKKLEKYLQNPTVRVFFDNFKVTILGEVTSPGIYYVQNERITIPEALGLAGDLSIFGKRTNVLVIREESGQREFATVDLSKRDLFESPYFFLHPNDVLYVEPVKGKTASSDIFYKITPLIFSTIALISVLFVRFNNN